MANNIGWGQGAVNNNIGWGQGASSNSISWGISQKDSYSGETEIYGIRADADSIAFYSKVTAAGGTLTATEQTAVNQLVVDLKAKGLWTSMKAIYPMVGSSAAACAQNLKSSSFTGTFAGGWTFASTGATPNGTNAYMNTTLMPSVSLAANNIHLSYYSRTNLVKASSSTMGSDNVGEYCRLIIRRTADVAATLIGNTTKGYTQCLVTDSRGLFIANAPNSTTRTFYKNGAAVTPISQTSLGTNGLTTFPIYLGCFNDKATAAEFDNKQCSFSSIGDGLTDTQAADFYTSVQAFQTTLSRQV